MIRLFISLILLCAVPFAIEAATKKKISDPEEALALAREAYMDYNVDEAREMFDTYETLMKRKKRAIPEDVEAEMSRVVMMENMLGRVEKIVVIDSIVVDAEAFFSHYRLSPEAGRLLPGSKVGLPNAEVAYLPQNQTELLFAAADSAGNYTLMGADILDDGTVDRALPLKGEDLAGGGNAEYPFLLSDGLTLYYANDGEGSIGGYDIFITRRDDDGSFLAPQNVGMPYNSPYDDYLLAIDEASGAGWWATDRNQIPGKLTVYVFIPAETRVNVDEDDPDLISRSKLDDISITNQGTDIQAVKDRIDAAASATDSSDKKTGRDFELAIGSAERIYHTLSDFRSATARKYMKQALELNSDIARTEQRLASLRQKWHDGNRSSGVTILNLEEQLAAARKQYAETVNRAISEELKVLKK